MTEDYDDKTDHCFFDLYFKCRNADANEVMLRMADLPEYKEWDVVDSMVRFGRWELTKGCLDPNYTDFRTLVTKHSELKRAVRRRVAKIIQEVLG